MAHSEHEHGGHGEHGNEKPHKATALWLIVTVVVICITVPLFILWLSLPKLP